MAILFTTSTSDVDHLHPCEQVNVAVFTLAIVPDLHPHDFLGLDFVALFYRPETFVVKGPVWARGG
jgi:hypothetical protein